MGDVCASHCEAVGVKLKPMLEIGTDCPFCSKWTYTEGHYHWTANHDRDVFQPS